MSEGVDTEQKKETYTYRLVTLAGLVIDFAAPQPLENIWTIIRGEGCFQMRDDAGNVCQRIPFHAIASLQYFNIKAAALAYAPSSGSA